MGDINKVLVPTLRDSRFAASSWAAGSVETEHALASPGRGERWGEGETPRRLSRRHPWARHRALAVNDQRRRLQPAGGDDDRTARGKGATGFHRGRTNAAWDLDEAVGEIVFFGIDIDPRARPSARITSPNPGISRSITVRAASGVTSRSATPVPPVVRISETCPESASRFRTAAIRSTSSGHHFLSRHLPAQRLGTLAQHRAGAILARAGDHRIADRHNRDADHPI